LNCPHLTVITDPDGLDWVKSMGVVYDGVT
jgi:hypothetical protein